MHQAQATRRKQSVCKVLESKVRKPKLAAKRELRENYPERHREWTVGCMGECHSLVSHTHTHTQMHNTQYRLHTTNTEVSPVPAEGGL